MYVQRYIVARSRKYCCHEKARKRSLFIVAGVDVAANIKLFSVAMEMQQWIPFALLSIYKIFYTADNNNKY
jgi:hypothetical protein